MPVLRATPPLLLAVVTSGRQLEMNSRLRSRVVEPVAHDFADDSFPWKVLAGDKPKFDMSLLQQSPIPVKVVGLFNTGTNYLQALIDQNLDESVVVFPYDILTGYRERRYDDIMSSANECLDGWKHILPRYQRSEEECHQCDVPSESVIIGMIRNPIPWMMSMRKPDRGYELTSCVEDAEGSVWYNRTCTWPACEDKMSWDADQPDKEWCLETSLCSQRTMENAEFKNVADLWTQCVEDYEEFSKFGFKRNAIIRYEDMVIDTQTTFGNVTDLVGIQVGDFKQVSSGANPTNDDEGVDQHAHDKALNNIQNKEYLQELGDTSLLDLCDSFGKVGKDAMCRHGYDDCGCDE